VKGKFPTAYALQEKYMTTPAATPATAIKRKQFLTFIDRVLKPETAVKGVIGIGSIATGLMRPDSDIDAIIFLDPYNMHIVPAESIWDAETDTFHSIFSDNPNLQANGLQLDFVRLDWKLWQNSHYQWPEERRSELAYGWTAYDPFGDVAEIIKERTIYPESLRIKRLDEAIIWLDQHLGEDGPQRRWNSLNPVIAHDRLQAAYSYLVRALFAHNRQWRIWRNREMSALLALPWLPTNFEQRIFTAANPPGLDYFGYMTRAEKLESMFHELLLNLIEDGTYGNDPIGEAFVRSAEEPGRSWNMDEWNRNRQKRLHFSLERMQN
jgi:hypothetical protein